MKAFQSGAELKVRLFCSRSIAQIECGAPGRPTQPPYPRPILTCRRDCVLQRSLYLAFAMTCTRKATTVWYAVSIYRNLQPSRNSCACVLYIIYMYARVSASTPHFPLPACLPACLSRAPSVLAPVSLLSVKVSCQRYSAMSGGDWR